MCCMCVSLRPSHSESVFLALSRFPSVLRLFFFLAGTVLPAVHHATPFYETFFHLQLNTESTFHTPRVFLIGRRWTAALCVLCSCIFVHPTIYKKKVCKARQPHCACYVNVFLSTPYVLSPTVELRQPKATFSSTHKKACLDKPIFIFKLKGIFWAGRAGRFFSAAARRPGWAGF